MKKIFTVIFLLCAFAGINNSQAADYTVETSNSETSSDLSEVVVVDENDFIQIVKQDEKFGIYDKKTGAYKLKPVADSIETFDGQNSTEYKIKIKNLIGYMNIENNVNFAGEYDNIIPAGEFIKVKKAGKYGLMNKQGNVVLNLMFDKINIVSNDTNEYIAAKSNGKYKLYTLDGVLIPESNLYTISSSDPVKQSEYMLVRDLRPELKVRKKFNLIVYEKAGENKSYSVDNSSDEEIFEIQELKIPPRAQKSENKNSQIDNRTLVSNSMQSENEPRKISITAGNKEFYLLSKGKKLGLVDTKGNVILPLKYNHIAAKNLTGYKNKTVFAADIDGVYYIYDLKGKLLAEQAYKKINMYQRGRLYTYTLNDKDWVLTYNNKIIGTLIYEDGEYEYQKQSFTFANTRKMNELLTTMLAIN